MLTVGNTVKMQFVFILLSLINLTEILASLSGFYVDNGRDQTEIKRKISRQEQLRFKRDMFDLLGIPQKPQKSSVHNTTLTTSAPKFLLDAYKFLEGLDPGNEFNMRETDFRSVEDSDTIMTFLTKNHHVNGGRHKQGKWLWFDVSDVPVADTILGAELRLYKLGDDEEVDQSFTITVYQAVLDYNGEELIHMDAVNVRSEYEGWLVFNATSAFVSWIAFPSSNRGLIISVHREHQPSHKMDPKAAGLILTDNEYTDQPFMVAFFKTANNNLRLKRRLPREASNQKKSDASVNRNPFSPPGSSWRQCQIQTMYVNFKDLQWNEWILAPEGYAAYYCQGVCDFPLTPHSNATNHAIIQALVHLSDPTEAPMPCCAPRKLAPMSFLVYSEDRSVSLKKFKNMVVLSCGCH